MLKSFRFFSRLLLLPFIGFVSYGFELDSRIGDTKVVTFKPAVSKKWTGNSSSKGEFLYEAPDGWVIVESKIHQTSKHGDCGYDVRITQKDSDYVSEEKFKSLVKELGDYAGEKGQDKARASLKEVQENSTEWFSRFKSKNAMIRIPYHGRSKRIKVVGLPVDEKTASLAFDVKITLARAVSTAEAELLKEYMKKKIDEGADISTLFALRK
jgi:hypothetical protein